MHKKSEDFSMEQLQKMAQSPAGQQLFALLNKQNSAQLNEAMSHAAAGDISKTKSVLSQLAASPEVMELLQKMKENSHG